MGEMGKSPYLQRGSPNLVSRVLPSTTDAMTTREAKRKRSLGISNTPTTSARRSRTTASSAGSTEVIDLTQDEPEGSPLKKKPRQARNEGVPGTPAPEKRARMYRNRPSKSFLDRKHRATTQRLVASRSYTALHCGLTCPSPECLLSAIPSPMLMELP